MSPKVAAVTLMFVTSAARGQALTPELTDSLKDFVGSRIEGLVVLAGDQGFSGGTLSQATAGTQARTANLKLTKFGAAGDVGHPKPLGSLLRWQPRFRGSIGYVKAKNHFNTGPLEGDEFNDTSFAIEFGGGARFWLGDHFSFAPTIMGIYGHTQNAYTARSDFAQANLAELRAQGLIDWTANTWSVVPTAAVRYRFTWRRTDIKLDSEFAYFYTSDFKTSNPNLSIGGSSQTWRNMVEADVPLGIEIFKHELHTGGTFSRTEIFGDLETAFETDHMYRVHGRLVLDFVDKLWKVKWIGVGGSYIWGTNFEAWTVSADLALQL